MTEHVIERRMDSLEVESGIINIREHGEIADAAAKWFHAKWGIPLEAYVESITACLEGKSGVPGCGFDVLAAKGAFCIRGGISPAITFGEFDVMLEKE